ncbi:MAG: bifunctional adenosylcobinamide kinase/adenosylcobinamide-phosphate guanylyltransferase [Pseudomonadota bacterium]
MALGPCNMTPVVKHSLILVLGGARSGKSRYAEHLASKSGRPVTYVATAGPPRDAEMTARIAAHQARRPEHWTTVEVATDLAEAVAGLRSVVLVDCLTLWLTNVLLAERDLEAEVDALVAALGTRSGAIIAVSNEVGEGIVPANALGRRFRDLQGMLNQRVAASATDVVKVVAGCAVIIKPRNEPEPQL